MAGFSAAALGMCLAACSGSATTSGGQGAAAGAASKYAQGLERGIDKSKEDEVRGDLGAAVRLLDRFEIDNSGYPSAASCAELRTALAVKGGGIPLNDPWGNAYECTSSESGYKITSAGEDGKLGTSDDISVGGG